MHLRAQFKIDVTIFTIKMQCKTYSKQYAVQAQFEVSL